VAPAAGVLNAPPAAASRSLAEPGKLRKGCLIKTFLNASAAAWPNW
jgi:hypothetical protein